MEMNDSIILIIVAINFLLIGILPFLSSLKAKYYTCLIYIAFNREEYTKIQSKLKSKNVSFLVKTSSHKDYSIVTGASEDTKCQQYHIYVQERTKYKAKKAIHST